MPSKKYDLVVIGSGPAGEKGAAQAAYFGKKVALIEKEPVLGGAAANTGTLPSKTLRESSLFLSGFKQRELQGIRVGIKEKVTIGDFLLRERVIKEAERSRIWENLKRHHVDLYVGTASLVDPHTVSVKPAKSPEVQISAEFVLVATGSSPHRPAEFPFHDPRVYDSDTILTLRELPPTMLVVGGGVIGCEYACMFEALGIDVTLVEGRDRLMGFLDAEISTALRASMEASGIHMLMPDSVESVEPESAAIRVRFKSGAILQTQTILVASGRNGNSDGLGLEKLGIAVSKRGLITVNEHYQTTVPHLYAAGDVIGFPALASTSMEQARIAMVHAFDLKYKSKLPSILPYGIYTIPECSMAGETEETLKEKKIAYVAGKATYGNNARGQIIGDTRGFLKLIFREEDMRLVGVHTIGDQATELVHVGLTALILEAGADLFIQTCFNYPTLHELYKYATYDALGRKAARQRGATA
ncbi:MAG: Si-specific NAD(P)(+) transhydrogenase [Planctomycetes bacterium]|nr:Si-specific NAD(P)(+) transhydrogenase [Planctomycetota bacterium]MBI3846182.1 Si-specific NAD(P)(+) transhydrogenase [Planctomycetota bacterium]